MRKLVTWRHLCNQVICQCNVCSFNTLWIGRTLIDYGLSDNKGNREQYKVPITYFAVLFYYCYKTETDFFFNGQSIPSLYCIKTCTWLHLLLKNAILHVHITYILCLIIIMWSSTAASLLQNDITAICTIIVNSNHNNNNNHNHCCRVSHHRDYQDSS